MLSGVDAAFEGAWGKRTEFADRVTYFPLRDHCADVAAVVEALLALPTIRKRLDQLAGHALSDIDLARLGALAFLHDMGKAAAGFWWKGQSANVQQSLPRPVALGHTREVLALLGSWGRQQLPSLATMSNWQDNWNYLLAAVSHHGDPIMLTDQLADHGGDMMRRVWAPIGAYRPLVAAGELLDLAAGHFPRAFTMDAPPLPGAPRLVHAFAGLVSLADWIASNTEIWAFPYDAHLSMPGVDRMAFARQRAPEVLRQMGIDLEAARSDLVSRALSFDAAFGFPPNEAQAAMGALDLGPIVVLEAETGSGKTEAALWRFKTLFEAGEVDSLLFTLPTRVAAVSLERRVRAFVERLFPDRAHRPAVLLAVPGYWRVDGVDRQHALADFDALYPDSDAQQEAPRRWASENPKRYLAASIAIGTVDQLLLAGLQARHAHLRAASALRSLLVIDEVHASDVYMTQTLKNVLDQHVAAGGHALLLSATLATQARSKLIAAGLADARARQRFIDGIAATISPYPAVSDRHCVRPVRAGERCKAVTLEAVASMECADDVARRAVVAARSGARVLVVRNTVRAALAVQQALEAMLGLNDPLLFRACGAVAPHHGRFAAEDRQVLDAAIEARFGKHAERAQGAVLVGTQTLEQSLDIDADLLITDLAPMDVLLQRLGRLHRHERARPAGFGVPHAIILTPADRDLAPRRQRGPAARYGLGSVYDNLPAIEATWRQIEAERCWDIPAMNRRLVETAVGEAALDQLVEQLGGDWRMAWQRVQGVKAAHGMESATARLEWRKLWSDQNWRRDDSQITTRLGADDRLLDVSALGLRSPFGQSLRQLKVPAYFGTGLVRASDIPLTAAVTLIGQDADGARLDWGGLPLRYSRWGLEVESDH